LSYLMALPVNGWASVVWLPGGRANQEQTIKFLASSSGFTQPDH
jgi:hypothetical protein